MTIEAVELGRALFFEPSFSLNGQLACSSCHEPELAFSVNEAVHQGATGDRTSRNAPSLANLAWASFLNWGNLTTDDLEQQILNPLFGDTPVEMGAGFIQGSDNHYDTARLISVVNSSPELSQGFITAFPTDEPDERLSWDRFIDAVSSFQRSLVSLQSPWDRWLTGDSSALSLSQQRGLMLFESERLACSECHAGPFLSLAFSATGAELSVNEIFRNTGLYNIEGGPQSYWGGARSRYPAPNMGIGEFTQRVEDDGKHRIPSLRNVTMTAPYMHDGSAENLEEVLDHYQRGGRIIEQGPYAGDGSLNPYKDPLISGFELTTSERAELLDFLSALTDPSFLQGED
ncbi:MAG: di-heme enzyme [Rickettsiales bacterium]|nr:di-heme enzyme [Rickettsiales bacterium]